MRALVIVVNPDGAGWQAEGPGMSVLVRDAGSLSGLDRKVRDLFGRDVNHDVHTGDDYARLTAAGAPSLSAPYDWLADLRLAWVADPDGDPIQLAGTASQTPADNRWRGTNT